MICACNICNKEFENKKSMTNHRRWHSLQEYRGFQKSVIIKTRISKIGSLNPNWKGDQVGIEGVHDYVQYRLTKPDKCVCCGVYKPKDLANISQEYKRDLSDWEWLCRRCHMIKDGRIYNLKQFTYENNLS